MNRPRVVRAASALATVVALVALAACSSSGGSSKSSDTTDATSSSQAAERVVTVKGITGPGPEKYNQFRVLQVGSKSAKNVLVLEPGTSAGAGSMRLDAQAIAKSMPDWQVWSVDRRENALEDHSVIDGYIDGEQTAKQAFDYYLGWLSD